MRVPKVILFFVIVFTVYFSVNAYVFFHGLRAIPGGTGLRTVYCVVFLAFALAFIVTGLLVIGMFCIGVKALMWIFS